MRKVSGIRSESFKIYLRLQQKKLLNNFNDLSLEFKWSQFIVKSANLNNFISSFENSNQFGTFFVTIDNVIGVTILPLKMEKVTRASLRLR